MKTRMKKTFALILALVMCLSLTAVCSFAAENEEPVYDVSGSKEASPTALNAKNDVTTVTLQLPSAEYKNEYDIVFVMDSSSSTKNSNIDFSDSVDTLLSSLIEKDAVLNVGVIKCRGLAFDTINLLDEDYSGLVKYSDETKELIKNAVSFPEADLKALSSGTNMHGGLVMADQWLTDDEDIQDDHKYVIFLLDGKTYIWNDEQDVATSVYGQYMAKGTVYPTPAVGQQTIAYSKSAYRFIDNVNFFAASADDLADLSFDEYFEKTGNFYTNDFAKLYASTKYKSELSSRTKYDYRCLYAYKEDDSTADGTATTHDVSNGNGYTYNLHKKYYEFVPEAPFEDLNWLQANPYTVEYDAETETYTYTTTVNEDFYQLHPDSLQKALYLTGHLWTEMVEKYNGAVITYSKWGSGSGLEIAKSFCSWIPENSDYGADLGPGPKDTGYTPEAAQAAAENVAALFDSIKEDILYMVATGVVTDVIPDDFTLENPDNADGFRMTLNGEALDVEYVEADGTWGFGGLHEGKYPYVISYNADTQTITWEINVPVENLKPVTLSYDLKLTDEAKATVSQGSSKDFDTNVSAVLAYETSDGDKGEYPFEIPVVTYSVPAPPPPPTPTTYTVTYVDGLGNTLGRFPGLSYGEDTPVIDDPTRTGYVFTGWDPEVSATVTKSVTYTAQWAPLPAIPIQLNGEDHFAYVQGYPDGTVRPENNITRAETATMFYRLLTPEYRDRVFTAQNDFSDVAKAAWFNKAVSSMANGEFILGYPDGTFMGDKSITRAEFVTVLVRFLDAPETADNPFSDVAGHWAEDYIIAAVAAGWVDGYPDGSFKPDTPITRAEAMKIINTVLHRGVNESSELGDYINFPDNGDATKWYYYEVIEATNNHEYEGSRPEENWLGNTVDYIYDIAKYENP